MRTPPFPRLSLSRTSRLALAASALLTIAAAAGLSDSDRKEGVMQLERTRNGIIEATKGLSAAQWRFQPAADRWSVAQILEHIALSEDFLFDHITKNVMQAPPGSADRDPNSIDKLVLTAIPDRSQKVQAPEPLAPKGRWSPEESLARFLKSRARTIEFLKSTSDLREHVVDAPIGQPMDAYQWLLFISAHSERHTRQILEVKNDPDFPKQ